MTKIKIYCDSGADISKIKALSYCEFYQFPYDSPHRPKKPLLLARPSEAFWEDLHASWEELDMPWDDFTGSPLYSEIQAIIGIKNRRDVLHFDSAYKTGCVIFLTSDKGDIWSKKTLLESATNIKTFCTPLEIKDILESLKQLNKEFI